MRLACCSYETSLRSAARRSAARSSLHEYVSARVRTTVARERAKDEKEIEWKGGGAGKERERKRGRNDDEKVEGRRERIELEDRLALGFVSDLGSSLWTQLWLTLPQSSSLFSPLSLFLFFPFFLKPICVTHLLSVHLPSCWVFFSLFSGFVRSRNEYPWLL